MVTEEPVAGPPCVGDRGRTLQGPRVGASPDLILTVVAADRAGVDRHVVTEAAWGEVVAVKRALQSGPPLTFRKAHGTRPESYGIRVPLEFSAQAGAIRICMRGNCFTP